MRRPTRAHALAAVLLAAAAAACSKPNPPAPPAAQPREEIGQITTVTGEAYLVAPDGSRQRASKGALAAGGKLVTGPDGHVSLVFRDGSRLEIGENGDVVWTAQGDQLTVTPGNAKILATVPPDRGPGALTVLIQTPYGMVRVPAGGAELLITKDAQHAAFDVKVGQVDFTRPDGKRIELRLGDRIEVKVAGIEIIRGDGTRTKLSAEAAAEPAKLEGEEPKEEGKPAPAPAPEAARPLPAPPPTPLVLAMSGDVHVFGDRLKEVTLTWPADVEAATVQVARDQRFKDIVLAGKPEGRHINLAPPKAGSMYWRVLDAGGQELRRAKAKFASDPSDGAGGATQTAVTDGGTAARIYYQGVAPAVTLLYARHPRAARYRLRISRASGGKPVLERLVTSTRYLARAGLLTDGEYVWSATPIDKTGATLGDLRENHLTIAYDNSQVTLVIQKPRPWQRVRHREVDVQGVAPLGSKLFINGHRTDLDPKGQFRLSVAASDAVVFKLVSAEGGETFWVRGLRAGS